MTEKQAVAAEATETQEDATDSPLIDSLGAAVKKMIARGKERGYITYDELNSALPPDSVSSEQIEDTMSMISEMGINVVENEEAEEPSGGTEPAEAETAASGNVKEDDIGRTDDPVRMYLREMGSVELLSREGEIAIAKRIEAGREKMIGGICESPMTIRALLAWRQALIDGDILLRDIIDLDATYGGGPDAEAINNAAAEVAEEGEDAEEETEETQEGETQEGKSGEEKSEDGESSDGNGLDEDDDEASLSLSAMEQALLPQVLETFDAIAGVYKKHAKVQEKRLTLMQKGEAVPKQTETRHGNLKNELVELMETVRLNNGRIEQLVDQLYGLNKRLVGLEGKLLRMAEGSGVSREDFLKYYRDMVEVQTNTGTDITVLRARAFSRDMATATAEAILELSDVLINNWSERITEDTLRFARNELGKAEDHVRDTSAALTKFRNEKRSVDPGEETSAILQIITGLEGELASTRAELIEKESVMKSSSAPVRTLRNRVAALERQIENERRRLAGESGTELTRLIDGY
ncbi:MAG: RNA polymerase sigma factor RpoD, partial [Rhodospirillales bacterium]|nr:RNA polymerase sigma factor RpoD [Rhodospirillales bacterium]